MPVAVERGTIAVVDGPADQADAALRTLAAWNDELPADEVTLGAANESVVPYLKQRLAEAGLVARFGAGRPLARSGPVLLLELLADYLERPGYGELAALARHPDVGHWLIGQGTSADYLTALDQFFSEAMPATIDHERPARSEHHGIALAVSRRIEKLLEPLAGKPTRKAARLDAKPPTEKPLPDWATPIARLVAEIYGNRQLDRSVEADRAILEICHGTSECLESLAGLPKTIAPKTTAAAALRLVIDDLAASRLPPPTPGRSGGSIGLAGIAARRRPRRDRHRHE